MEPVPPFFYFAGRNLHAVRDGKWKLRIAGPKAPTELYDLETDPSERHNVAAEHPGEVQRLRAIMEEFLATLPR
jgi:arylsulfatase A-like enzyme